MSEQLLYYIYKTINLINNKYYIGAHQSTDIENDPYLGSGNALEKALKKYGKENFVRKILYIFDNETDMFLMEDNLVDPKDPMSYNLVRGGKGGGFVGKFFSKKTTYKKSNVDISSIYNMSKTQTCKEIAEIFNVHTSTVNRWLRKYKQENNIVDKKPIKEIKYCIVCNAEIENHRIVCSKQCCDIKHEASGCGTWKEINFTLEELYNLAHTNNFSELGRLTGLSTNGVKNRIIKYAARHNLPPIEYDKTGGTKPKELKYSDEEIYNFSKQMTYVEIGKLVGLTGWNVGLRVKKYCLENNLPNPKTKNN